MSANRLLLVEDDPVSAAFLLAVLRERGEVVHVGTIAAASAALQHQRFDALVSDCRLPDGHAVDLLAGLAADGITPPPALALSAELDAVEVARLTDAGFAASRAKPLGRDALHSALDGLLAAPGTPWNDAAADRALGLPPAQRRQLRQLLLQELPDQLQRARDAIAQGAPGALNAELHRLKASCGFCGATALLHACEALSREANPGNLAAFEQACGELLRAGADG